MTETPQFALPLVQAAQAQKHVTVNTAFEILDAVAQISITAVNLTVPPPSPVAGSVYSIGVGATDAWTGEDGKLAVFVNGGWLFVLPVVGWRAWRLDTGVSVTFDGEGWVAGGGAFSAHGAGFVHKTIEVDHVVGAGSLSTVSGLIPANTVVYGVTARVLSDLSGPASIEIGVSGSTNRYGSGIGVTQGAWARGLTGNPLAYYSDTDVVLTAAGGDFSGAGVIRIAVHFAELTLPRG